MLTPPGNGALTTHDRGVAEQPTDEALENGTAPADGPQTEAARRVQAVPTSKPDA